jgi:hypothetical protein
MGWGGPCSYLGEQVLHVDAGADEEVAEGEGDERERDGGGQVRAAVLGQELLGLVRPGLLPLASLFLLGAEHLQRSSVSSHRCLLAGWTEIARCFLLALLTFQRPNSRPYFSVISSAVLASPSFVSCTAETASCRRGSGGRRAREAREPRCSWSCSRGNRWLRCCLAVGAARLGRSRAVAAMDGRGIAGTRALEVEEGAERRRGGDAQRRTR